MEEKPLSYLIDSLIPEYIKDEYPTYVSFITKYLEILESEDDGPFKVLNEITKFIDVDITPEDTLTNFVSQYLNSFPVEFLENVNIREFITNAKNFYSQKGNEAGIRFIFNLIGGDLKFYYPSLEIFELNTSLLSGDTKGSGNPTHKLHDNYFYAYYVYEIQTDLNYEEYEEIIRKMTHPIGEKIFFNKIIYIPVNGTELFDMQALGNTLWIDMTNEYLIYMNDGSYIPNYIINLENDDLTAYPRQYSPIIGDWFSTIINSLETDNMNLTVYAIMSGEAPVSELTYTVINTDIGFTATNSIYSTTTDFSVFAIGDSITVSGTTAGTNDGVYTISTVNATSIITTETTISTQATGPSVSITNS